MNGNFQSLSEHMFALVSPSYSRLTLKQFYKHTLLQHSLNLCVQNPAGQVVQKHMSSEGISSSSPSQPVPVSVGFLQFVQGLCWSLSIWLFHIPVSRVLLISKSFNPMSSQGPCPTLIINSQYASKLVQQHPLLQSAYAKSDV